jgi:predicted permease
MPLVTRMASLWRNLRHRGRMEQDLDEELHAFVDLLSEEKIRAGMSAPEARRAAAMESGGVEQVKEAVRDARAGAFLETLAQDLRYAARALRHSPAFTVAAVTTLALGIGATTAIYSVVRTVWLRSLPYESPDRVVRIWEKNARLNVSRFSASPLNFLSWRERSRSFESLIAMEGGSANLTDEASPDRVRSLAVTAQFFGTLGIRPVLGRAFASNEDAPGGERVIMLSERLWRSRYAGDPGVIGRTIPVNGENSVVIGIAPADMGFASDIDLWQPLTIDVAQENRGDHHVVVLGRLTPGVTVSQAEAELDQLAVRLEMEFPNTNRDWRVWIAPVQYWIVDQQTRQGLLLLAVAVGLLLVVACINVANLLLARASARVREFGIRRALGAGRGRLVRQLVTEGLVLACAGGAAGVLLGLLGVEGLRVILPANVPRAAQLSLDVPVLATALALTLATGLLFGLAPAWVAGRLDVQRSIQQARGASAGVGPLRLRQALVAGEFALAAMLVGSAGLLLASFRRLESVDLGFQPGNVLTARISLPRTRYTYERAQAFYRDLQVELNAVPGLQAAGVASRVPFAGSGNTMQVSADYDAPSSRDTLRASFQVATSGYFRALRIPLLRGRLFDDRDASSGTSILLSQGLVRRLWPDGGDPIGRLVRLGDNPPSTVVGVVGDVRQSALNEDPDPSAYLPAWSFWDVFVVARSPGEPAALVTPLRRVVAKLDSQLPIYDVRPLEDLKDANAAPQRLTAALTGAFALLALLLGAVGVAGVVAYSVLQRTPEIAVRMALGATPARVVRAMTTSGFRLCLVGLVLGLAGAAALWRALAGLLFQVRPNDPAIFSGVAAVLLAAALLASWLPARRVVRIDPIVELRKE